MSDRISFEPDGAALNVRVRQRRFEPLVRWSALTVGTMVTAALFGWALGVGLPPTWPWRLLMVALGIALFVAVLTVFAGLLMVVPLVIARRSAVAFRVHPLGIEIERPARRLAERDLHRDAIAGPFVRVDDAIDEEASAATMMRMGGDEMATALAEGARATGGSADTMTWFLFRSSAASVTVLHRSFNVVLAEGLHRDEAEELAHRVAEVLERLPG